jgi:glycosyltransferase involved in cell wall biosynthesis
MSTAMSKSAGRMPAPSGRGAVDDADEGTRDECVAHRTLATRRLNRIPPATNVVASALKLLVLAHVPPPVHGQSVMVQAMLKGLAQHPGLALHHVDFRLSRETADIGRWRCGKFTSTVRLARQAVREGRRQGCDTLYYVPAPPGKRGALYRDWAVMTMTRRYFRRLVLHWHAAGLADWLVTKATRFERTITRALIGRADLSIVLAASLRADAASLGARRIEVVPNGVPDPGPPASRPPGPAPFQALFLGLCSDEKGVFAAAEAVLAANRSVSAPAEKPRFRLTAAGPFAATADAKRMRALTTANPAAIQHIGFAGSAEKRALFAASDCLIFPTRYAAEGQPLVVLEALAHDLPVIATYWRALPDIVTPECGRLVAGQEVAGLADALVELQRSPLPAGTRRARFLRKFTLERHLDGLAAALARLDSTGGYGGGTSSSG